MKYLDIDKTKHIKTNINLDEVRIYNLSDVFDEIGVDLYWESVKRKALPISETVELTYVSDTYLYENGERYSVGTEWMVSIDNVDLTLIFHT